MEEEIGSPIPCNLSITCCDAMLEDRARNGSGCCGDAIEELVFAGGAGEETGLEVMTDEVFLRRVRAVLTSVAEILDFE